MIDETTRKILVVLEGSTDFMMKVKAEEIFGKDASTPLKAGAIIAAEFLHATQLMIATMFVNMGIDKTVTKETLSYEADAMIAKIANVLEEYKKEFRERMSKGN